MFNEIGFSAPMCKKMQYNDDMTGNVPESCSKLLFPGATDTSANQHHHYNHKHLDLLPQVLQEKFWPVWFWSYKCSRKRPDVSSKNVLHCRHKHSWTCSLSPLKPLHCHKHGFKSLIILFKKGFWSGWVPTARHRHAVVSHREVWNQVLNSSFWLGTSWHDSQIIDTDVNVRWDICMNISPVHVSWTGSERALRGGFTERVMIPKPSRWAHSWRERDRCVFKMFGWTFSLDVKELDSVEDRECLRCWKEAGTLIYSQDWYNNTSWSLSEWECSSVCLMNTSCCFIVS